MAIQLQSKIHQLSNQAFETQVGLKLPPSFREFISLHNGWQNCAGELLILPLKKQLDLAKKAAKQYPDSEQFHFIGQAR